MNLPELIDLMGQLGAYRRRAERAARIIHEALQKPVRWAISFSGGKDSTVLLDLVLRQRPGLEIVWFDDGWDYPETLAFLAQTETRLGQKILRVPYPLKSSFWKHSVDYGGDDPLYNHAGDLTYTEWQQTFGGAFIGMRKQESAIRHFTLNRRGPIYFQQALQHWHCCPLYDWSHPDVWGYIAGEGLPYNPVYDRLSELGTPFERLRVGPLTAWMVWQYGILAVLKHGWPDLFNRFVAAHPEARSYT